jgi:hypothetical protein
MPDSAYLGSKSTESIIAIEMAPVTAEVVHIALLSQRCALYEPFRKSMVSICFTFQNDDITTQTWEVQCLYMNAIFEFLEHHNCNNERLQIHHHLL